MNYILHRGYHQTKAEENKLPAFQKGLSDERYIGIETDIRQTKDEVFVLYHDPLFKGKLVKSCSYAELKKAGIIRLKDLLNITTNKILLLEIKDFNLNLTKLLKLLAKYPRKIYLMSFSNKVIAQLKKLNCPYKLGILNYVFNTLDNYPYDFICLLNDTIDEVVLKSYQRLNIEVIGYGIRHKSGMYADITYIIENTILDE